MNKTPANPIDKAPIYIAAGLVSGAGALMFNVMPVFVGAMAETLAYSESQLGDAVAVFNLGFTLISLTAIFWIRKIDWRVTGLFATLAASIGLALMPTTQSYSGILLFIGLVGLAMGGLYALILAVLGDSDSPDRAFGLKLGLETLPGVILLFLLPTLIVPASGFSGAVYTMAGTVMLLGAASIFLPSHGKKTEATQTTGVTIDHSSNIRLPLLALCSSLVFFTGIAASWAFLELLANAKGLASGKVGSVLAVAFIICGIGGFIAAVLGDKYGRKLPLIAIILINWLGLWYLASFSSLQGYAIGACLLLFSVNFALAYTFGLTAEVDEQGKFIVLSAASLSIGATIGPTIAGRLVEAQGFNMVLLFSAGCSLVALLLYLGVIKIHKN